MLQLAFIISQRVVQNWSIKTHHTLPETGFARLIEYTYKIILQLRLHMSAVNRCCLPWTVRPVSQKHLKENALRKRKVQFSQSIE